ncbi:hypothetical protein [Neptuniibacter sp. QD37_11]|uniref:hypothetical protein n=1 Tax=Neptuniibacter sp. QD37_11 TaxID=3398209 RepID=UPI0039F4717D
MEFGKRSWFGQPLYLNGQIAGWICSVGNGRYSYCLAGHRVDAATYPTRRKAQMALLSIFGE